MNDESCGNASSILFSFLLGGIVGAGLALLLAPQSGAETRRKITDASGDLREKADEFIDQAKTSVDSAIHKGRDIVEEKKSVLASAIEAGKEAFKKEKAKEAAEDV